MLTRDVVPSMVAREACSQQMVPLKIQRPAITETHVKGIATDDKMISEKARDAMYRFEGLRSLGFLYKAISTRTLPTIEAAVITMQIKVSTTTSRNSRLRSSRESFSNLTSFEDISSCTNSRKLVGGNNKWWKKVSDFWRLTRRRGNWHAVWRLLS